jgi:tetratricopeptide (TPR) repeat protein
VKQIGEYFGVSTSSISQKVFDIEDIFEEDIDDDIFEMDEEKIAAVSDMGGMFVDADRFEVSEEYWDFLESGVATDARKSIEALKKIIKKDPDYYEPYISLYEYYMQLHDTKNAFEILQKGYERVMKRIAPDGIFPIELLWGYVENRHIIRLLFNVATMYWAAGKRLDALSIFLQLLRSEPQDNIGARYAAVALLEGYRSYEHFEMEFAKDGTLDIVLLTSWFDAKVLKHQEFLGCWLSFWDDV